MSERFGHAWDVRLQFQFLVACLLTLSVVVSIYIYSSIVFALCAGLLILALYLGGRLYTLEQDIRLSDEELKQALESQPEALKLQVRTPLAPLKNTINVLLEQQEAQRRHDLALQQRLRLALAAVNDGLWNWDLVNNSLQVSARWQELLGLGTTEHQDSIEYWFDLIHKDDLKRLQEQLQRFLDGESALLEAEVRILHQDEKYRWMLVRGQAARDAKGQVTYLSGSLTDLTQRSLFDALTGLPNRSLLTDRLWHALSRQERQTGSYSALLFMDLNRFKVINDSLGHHIGDLLLIELAKRLQLCVRTGDTVARLGGDEFVILLENLESEPQLMQIVDRIQRYTSSSFEISGNHIVSSTSIGVVADISQYGSVEELLRNSDIAMYDAKAAHKSYMVFNPDMHARVSAKQQLEIEMRRGMERGEFFLMYQPIVSLISNDILGYEALVRWQHPERGMVNPNDFIPLAEETGLIIPLGEWILREACYQMHSWQLDHQSLKCPSVNVNLSGKQLSQPTMVAIVKEILEQSGLEPQRLKLEITESAIIEDPKRIAGILHELKALGVQICMDDFGTGYSSLSYIHNLPIDVLKIDRSFVAKMMEDSRTLAIVRTMTEMARHLEIEVIPEGIESLEQMLTLRELNCQLGQGYLFSRPMKLEDSLASVQALRA